MITETLTEINLLTEKEAKMYYLLLAFEEMPASLLAKKLNMNKGSIHYIGESLLQKGIIIKTRKNNISYFRSEPPKKLITYLERGIEEAQEKFAKDLQQLHEIIPFLEKTRTKPSQILHSKVSYYEGLDNVLQAYLNFLENVPENNTIYSYVSPAPIEDKKFRKLLQKTIDKRLEKNIHCKIISTYCEESARLKLTDKHQNRETLIAFKDLGVMSETMLSRNQTFEAFYSTSGMVANLTTNTNNAIKQIESFKLAWQQAKIEDQVNCKLPEFQQWLIKNKGLEGY